MHSEEIKAAGENAGGEAQTLEMIGVELQKFKQYPVWKRPTYVVQELPGIEHAPRYLRYVGKGIEPPSSIFNTIYYDKKCPFTGYTNVRGKIITATIEKMSANPVLRSTVRVVRKYLHYVPKYKRYEWRRTRLLVHLSPCFTDAKPGSLVLCGETRKLSRNKSFVVIKILGTKQDTVNRFMKIMEEKVDRAKPWIASLIEKRKEAESK